MKFLFILQKCSFGYISISSFFVPIGLKIESLKIYSQQILFFEERKKKFHEKSPSSSIIYPKEEKKNYLFNSPTSQEMDCKRNLKKNFEKGKFKRFFF